MTELVPPADNCEYAAGPDLTDEGRGLAGPDAGRFFGAHCPPGLPIVGKSSAAAALLRNLRLVAKSNCNPVLIVGRTGTGKELAARAVHHWRHGAGQPFVAVNCAALTASLLESELFGHVKGSFTGADRDKTGLFEAAGKGTILLDEISEMPLDLQAKLLRVLQERTFRKVGGTQDIPTAATIIATSNRNLRRDAHNGTFRLDLYFRLAVFPITIPPLRDPARRGDIALLAEYFLVTTDICPGKPRKTLSPEALQLLQRHDWPGNVRELSHVIDRAVIVARADEITPADILIDGMDHAGASDDAPAAEETVAVQSDDFSLETAERIFIMRALDEAGWQRTRAAALLGITRATLLNKLKRYGIHPPGTSTAADAAEANKPADKPRLQSRCNGIGDLPPARTPAWRA